MSTLLVIAGPPGAGLSTGGNLTQLGEALAGYGRIFKTLHVLAFVDDVPYRRQIKDLNEVGTTWAGTSSMVAAANCTAPTTTAWRTSSARSDSC